MGFQEKWFGLPILLLILFMANSITLTDSADNIHDFLGLNEPFFNPNIDSIFTAQEGGVAYLSCEVFNLNNKSVSWVREKDNHILTVDRETFISGKSHKSENLKNNKKKATHKIWLCQ